MTTKSIERATFTFLATALIFFCSGLGGYHLARESGRPPALSFLLAFFASSGISGVAYGAMKYSNQEADEADHRPSNAFAKQVELVNQSVEGVNGLVSRVNESVDKVRDNPELYGQTFKEGAALIDSSTRALDSSTRALEISRQALQEARAFDQQLALGNQHGTHHLLSPTNPAHPNVLPFAKPIRIHSPATPNSGAEGEGSDSGGEEIPGHRRSGDGDNGSGDRVDGRLRASTGPSPCDAPNNSSSYLPLNYL
jgi:hypothetical protein